jgi:tRNA(fMet)-specific endonuclease VapC
MPLYALDTDSLTLYREGHPQVGQRVLAHAPSDIATTVISAEEQLAGWYAQLRQARQPDRVARAYERLAATIRFYTAIPLLLFTLPAIARYQQLLQMKLNVGKMDLRIGAVALEHGATVITRNLRDFQRIPNLMAEDWSV